GRAVGIRCFRRRRAGAGRQARLNSAEYTRRVVPIAVLTFAFDPIAHPFADLAIRWGVLALAGILVAALVLGGVLARGAGLRADDLAFIAIGAVPGAVVGGRLGYAVLHWDVYGASLRAITDPSTGSLELGLGALGGLLSA